MLFEFIAEIQTTLAFLLTLLIGHSTTVGAPVVALKYGVFQGAFDGNLSTFLGVPFAQPTYVFNII